MAAIEKGTLAHPDETIDFAHGKSFVQRAGDEEVWRSELAPGWSWDEDVRPYTDGLTSCPMTHREYVIAGRMRYLMADGTEEIAEAGDFLFIPPGHRAWVAGEEICVLIDW